MSGQSVIVTIGIQTLPEATLHGSIWDNVFAAYTARENLLLAAHALGRVGEISERQLQLPEFQGLAQGSLVGQAGIESRYNRELMGKDGFRRVVVNSRGLEVTEASRQPPEDGPNLTLSIDAGLQAAVEKAFEGRAGSAVALDPRTGEILAMASTPAYDPNEFTTGIDPTLWASLATDPQTPLMNRVIQGAYSPGSTFKVIAATAALEEGLITPATTFYCPGYLNVYNTTFHCRGGRGHGLMDLRGAIANSCNVYFYQVGIRLEIGRLGALDVHRMDAVGRPAVRKLAADAADGGEVGADSGFDRVPDGREHLRTVFVDTRLHLYRKDRAG